MGYLLSNLSTGVFFNDNTKLIQDDHKNYYYYERQGADKYDTLIKFNDPPLKVEKKVLIHQRFARYIIGDNEISLSGDPSDKQVYVKKWVKTPHAIMFKLSNHTVQVIFKDQTEILLSTDSKLVTFKNKANSRVTYTMKRALELETQVGRRDEEIGEFLKRLKYTRDLI
jgi:polo-like kinase 1